MTLTPFNINYNVRVKLNAKGIKALQERRPDEPPTAHHSIERINNDGNYEPSNCRWATWKEQGTNRVTSRYVVLSGERIIVTEFARRVGCNLSYALKMFRKGWTADRLAAHVASSTWKGRRRVSLDQPRKTAV